MLYKQRDRNYSSHLNLITAVQGSSLFLVKRLAHDATYIDYAFQEACQKNNYKIFDYLYLRATDARRSACLHLTRHNMQMFSRLWPEANEALRLNALVIAAQEGRVGIVRRYLREIPEPQRRLVFREAVRNAQKKIIVYTMRHVDLVEALPGFYFYQYVYLWESGIISKEDLVLHGIVTDPLAYANEHLRYERQHDDRDQDQDRRDAYNDYQGWSDDDYSDYGPYDNGM